MIEARNVYTYVADLNLFHDVYENYEMRITLNAVHAELESAHFNTYEECLADCNSLVDRLKTYLEKLSGAELVIGWEANPARNTDPAQPHLTPLENWEPAEIVHVFLFAKSDGEITTKTVPVAACSIRVDVYNPEDPENLNS